ncbi:MAG TPA: ABC transporter permease [Humisphaera sp.]
MSQATGTQPLDFAPAAPANGRSGGLWLPALSLAKREWVRFLRQPHRVVGALATPIVFWLLIGLGMGRSFRGDGLPGGGNYLEFFFPGTVLMILLFTAIFSTISIIEDRREGFLQGVLVAPVPRSAIVLGKVLGGSGLALAQGLIVLLLGPLAGLHLTVGGFLEAAGLMAVVAFALTTLGFCIAWPMTSTQGFHAVMNLFLMPMWFLSGALFPPRADTFAPLRWVMQLNPLTYGLAGIRRALYSGSAEAAGLPGWGLCVGVSVGSAAALFAVATWVARRRTSADWQA